MHLAGSDSDGLADSLLHQLEGCQTRIWLQLRPDCDRALLVKQLADLSPYMLLNLRQLR